jgi:hypothetical protein
LEKRFPLLGMSRDEGWRVGCFWSRCVCMCVRVMENRWDQHNYGNNL